MNLKTTTINSKNSLRLLPKKLLNLSLTVLLIIGSVSAVIAQKPKTTTTSEASTLSVRDCISRSAGTVSFGPIVGQSNNGAPDTLFLCYGDEIFIQNNKDGDFQTGDPVPATPSAVGYLMYSCKPTINGNDFAAIQGDCDISNPTPGAGKFWYLMGTPNGDITLNNDGGINDLFAGGSPFVLWLAPSTFDKYQLVDGEYEGEYEGGGSCIKVSTQAAFPVVFLNEVKIINFKTTSPTALSGSFNIIGGFPEFNAAAHYTITMELVGNPSVKANISNAPFTHGKKVQFAVPQAGRYKITINDGYSCTHTEFISLPYDEITVSVASATVSQNDNVCLDVTVANFKQVISAQFSVNFDPNKLKNATINFGTNPLNLSLGGNFGMVNVALGEIRFLWSNPVGIGTTLPDNTVLFQLCFDAVGTPGTMTDVRITNTPIQIDFVDDNNVTFNPKINNGKITITAPQQLTLDIRICSTTGGSGTITVIAYGPEAQYNYYFNGGLPQVINEGIPHLESGLTPGNYTVRVSNSSLSEDITIPVQVSNAPPIQIAETLSLPSCSYNKDGSISLNLSGGVGPYSIEWNTFEFNKNAIGNLTNGRYTVKVIDSYGCQQLDTFVLDKKSISILPPTIVNPGCSGVNTGSITESASGGTPFSGNTYNFNWSNGVTQSNMKTSTISGLADGQYSVTITDSNGCTAVTSFDLDPGIVLNASAGITDTKCFGYKDGAIIVTATTDGVSTGPYTFMWDSSAGTPNNTATTSTVSNLPQGDYQVTITDGGLCNIVRSYHVGGFGEIQFFFFGEQPDNCSGNPSGEITVFVNGEAVPFIGNPDNFYRFTWSNGTTSKDVDAGSLKLVNLSGAGGLGKPYYVTITDANGCTADTTFYIKKKDAPLIQFDTIQTIACQGGAGGIIKAQVTASAGNEITSITWSSNAGTPVQTGNTKTIAFSEISNLSGGIYILTVKTANGCDLIDTVELQGAGTLSALDIITPASCAGVKDGSIQIMVNGGTIPYHYNWSNNGPDSPTQNNLAGGSYTVSISDASGCPPLVKTYIIPENPSIITAFDVASIKPSSCYDAVVGDGQAKVNASGGNAATYTFIWSSGETNTGTSSTATKLNGGMQYVTISDGICTRIDSVLIPSTPAIIVDKVSTIIKDESCFNSKDGAINLVATGGNGGFTYNWLPSVGSNANLSNLSSGTYLLTITDSKNCILRDSFKIRGPALFVAVVDSNNTTDITCAGANDGKISIKISGGNAGAVNYNWIPGVGGNNGSADNLGAGNYQISVTDSKGCTDVVNVQLTEPIAMTVTYDPIAELQCAGFKTKFDINNVTGGKGPGYKFSIDNGPRLDVFTPAMVSGGDHLLTVYDENGCTYTENITVKEPLPILVSLPEEVKVNLGDSVLLSPEISAVFPIDLIEWSPGGILSCTSCDATFASPFENSYVTVKVTDVNGCIATDSTLVIVDKSRKVFIPNVFSPNRDGINDKFEIYTGPGVAKISYFRIFDRWGACMYEEKDLAPNHNGTARGWDGWYKGKEMPPGVYTYVTQVEFEDKASQLYFGSVTLIR